MQLKYGSYAFNANGTEITARTETVRNEAGAPYKQRRSLHVAGYMEISGDTVAAQQADCTTKMNALEAALAKPFQDLIFYQDSGAESATSLRNSDSIGGVVVTAGPHYPDGIKGYTSVQRFEFTAEAEYYILAEAGLSANITLSFEETLKFSGGGPRFIYKESIVGPPQRQKTCDQTVYRVTQTGRAVGLRGYPSPAAPIWPANLLQAPDIDRIGPDRMGWTDPRSYEGFGITWSYDYGSAVKLIGAPTLWRGT